MSQERNGLLEFGSYRIDREQRVLLSEHEIVPLAPKVFDTLLVLVESTGRVIEKDELLKKVWPDTFVGESSLARNISTLRKVLGQSPGDEGYIQTIPKRGYRFVPEVRSPADTKITTAESASSPARRIPTLKLGLGLTALVLAGAAVIGVRSYLSSKAKPQPVHSLIVLPFVNLSGAPDSEYFSDGLTEEVIDNLVRIPDLRVVARTTAFQYKGKPLDIRLIGTQLNTDAALEGSVRRQGNRLRITAQLNSTRNGYHYWSQTWEREVQDVFAVQEEIAHKVAEAIHQGKQTSLPFAIQPPTHNLAAYDSYLRGMYLQTKLFSGALEQAIAAFQDAAQKDPNFAAAHAQIANTYLLAAMIGRMPPAQAYPIAEQYLQRALSMEPSFPAAQAAQGWISTHFDWDWIAAERAIRNAIQGNPSDPFAHFVYSGFLVAMKRMPEAFEESQRALEADPANPEMLSHLGWIFFINRKPEQTIRLAQRAADIDPAFKGALGLLKWAYEETGQFDAAIAVMKRLALPPALILSVSSGFQSRGAKGYFQGYIDYRVKRLGPIPPTVEFSPYGIATFYSRLGETGEALRWLEQGIQERDGWMVYMNVDPLLDNVRGEPRLQDLVRRIGLP